MEDGGYVDVMFDVVLMLKLESCRQACGRQCDTNLTMRWICRCRFRMKTAGIWSCPYKSSNQHRVTES